MRSGNPISASPRKREALIRSTVPHSVVQHLCTSPPQRSTSFRQWRASATSGRTSRQKRRLASPRNAQPDVGHWSHVAVLNRALAVVNPRLRFGASRLPLKPKVISHLPLGIGPTALLQLPHRPLKQLCIKVGSHRSIGSSHRLMLLKTAKPGPPSCFTNLKLRLPKVGDGCGAN